MTHNEVAWLVAKHQRDDLTSAERLQLEEWLIESPVNVEVFNELTNPGLTSRELAYFCSIDAEAGMANVQRKIRRHRLKQVAAFAVPIVIAIWVFISIGKQNKMLPNTTVRHNNSKATDNNVDSGKIYVTIGKGPAIEVQDRKDGLITQNGNQQLLKKGKTYIFRQLKSGQTTTPQAVKIATTWASQAQIELPDNSKIMLNTASSVRYPADPMANGRSVQMEGEASFDITHIRNKPFSVIVSNTEFKVLGTRFNINAYPNEGRIKASLLKGQIKIIRGNEQIVLSENTSVLVWPSKAFEVYTDSLVDESFAWNDDENFDFDDESLNSIIRQLERWYHVKINFTDSSGELYTGIVKRHQPVEQALKKIFNDKMQVINRNRVITLLPVHNKQTK